MTHPRRHLLEILETDSRDEGLLEVDESDELDPLTFGEKVISITFVVLAYAPIILGIILGVRLAKRKFASQPG